MIYYVDFNPNHGTRFDGQDRHCFGPYSSHDIANKVLKQIANQLGFCGDTPLLEIIPVTVDEPEYFVFGQSMRRTVSVSPKYDPGETTS